MNNELVGVISNEGELKGVIEDDNFNVMVQIMEAGPRGPQGKDGYTPIKGVDYFDGEKGDKGEAGPKGDTGDKGETGPKGDKGDQGEVGPKGDKGDIGEQGPRGLQGPKGDPFVYDDFTPTQLESLKGPQGIQGPKGDKGDTGEQGPPGNDGYTPVKGVDYFDGIDGEQGPKGDKGDKGDVGPQGEIGPQGPKGDKGGQGEVGPKGDKGEVGPKGDTGEVGPKGDTGEQGDIGPKGDKGDTGEQGPPGNDGYTPIKGVDYFDGEQGLSAYEVWLNQGNEGTVEDYLSSLKGSDAEVTIENIEKALGYTPAESYDLSEYATTDYVNTKNTVSVLDTRDEAYTPSWYMQNQDRNMVFEFKRRSTIGNPPENSSSGLHYSLMLTMVPWKDSSGGFPTQITFGNSIALRRGIGNTEWENWVELASMSDIPFNTSELTNDSGFITANEIPDVDLSNLMPKSGGVLENYTEKLTALESGAINLSLGNVFTHTLSGNTTYSITNAVSGVAHSFTLTITQTSTVRTLTFPSSVKWQGGEIPDLTTGNKTYVLSFMTVDGGTNWLGMFGGEF